MPAFPQPDVCWLRHGAQLYQDSLATTPVSNDGDPVGAWLDISGNGADFLQANNALRPTYGKGISPSGADAVRFNGTTQYLQASNFDSGQQGSVFGLIRLNSEPNPDGSFLVSTNPVAGGLALYAKDSVVQPQMSINGLGINVYGVTTVGLNTWYCQGWQSDGAQYLLYLSGTSEPINAGSVGNNGDWWGDTAGRDRFSLAAYSFGPGVGSYLHCDIVELMMYSTALSGGDLQSVLNYICGLSYPLTRLRGFIMASGKTYTKQEGTVWLRKHHSLNAFVWGDECMRLEDIASNEGGLTVTQKQNPRGGLQRDGVILGAPAESTTSLVFKRKQFDTMKTEIRDCLWDIDARMNCAGKDRELFNSWEEITRICASKITTRTLTGTSFDGDDEEMMVTGDITALDTYDIYRVDGEEDVDIASLVTMLYGVTTAQPERCPQCDPQEDCVLFATYEGVTGATPDIPGVLRNLSGGEPSAWASVMTLTGATGESLEGIVAFGDFFCATNNIGSEIVYSDDAGTNFVQVALASAPAANAQCIDAIDGSYIVVGCAAGDIFASTDQGRNWVQIADALSANDIIGIRIARDNPQIMYAIDSASANVFKSENAGNTWYTVGATGGGNLTALRVINQHHILVGSTAGELFESEDGGVTFTEQNDLPGIDTKASMDVLGFAGCGCGVEYVITFETTIGSKIYRNVDGGADGRWFEPTGNTASGATVVWNSVTCCDANRAVAVGGVTQVSESALLLA